jgi:quercetin dioxygenase-like cupin family protein
MDIEAYIESGILEMYVLGQLSETERSEVELYASNYPAIQKELHEIALTMQKFDEQNARQTHATVKPMIWATIDLMDRMAAGEKLSVPPILNENSSPADYAKWIERADMLAPKEIENIYGKIIGANEQATTIILWIKHIAPEETHHDEYERFLILEGTCNIVVSGKVQSFKSGDYFQIPLHEVHEVIVTSDIPCKAILQRVKVAA